MKIDPVGKIQAQNSGKKHEKVSVKDHEALNCLNISLKSLSNPFGLLETDFISKIKILHNKHINFYWTPSALLDE